jgi:hypothetical protein
VRYKSGAAFTDVPEAAIYNDLQVSPDKYRAACIEAVGFEQSELAIMDRTQGFCMILTQTRKSQSLQQQSTLEYQLRMN